MNRSDECRGKFTYYHTKSDSTIYCANFTEIKQRSGADEFLSPTIKIIAELSVHSWSSDESGYCNK